ncbi:MAG: M56 family metallopeptidase [Lachnospiraceae bacterium]|nr:M56 family metallopeptidase [Lachnospiraceae bacterium]
MNILNELFLKIIENSIDITFLILAILIVRFLFDNIPKKKTILLWSLVGIRLAVPPILNNPFSLGGRLADQIRVYAGMTEPVMTESSPLIVLMPAYGNIGRLLEVTKFVWAAGVFAMAAYTLWSVLRIRKMTEDKQLMKENVYRCRNVKNAFIAHPFRPCIYLPESLAEDEIPYVIAHERMHIRRKDLWWKALAFFFLSVYWFHPLMWAAFICFQADIEYTCDEAVTENRNLMYRKNYAEALFSCAVASSQRTGLNLLAFGRSKTEKRISRLLHKKVQKKGTLAAFLVCALVLSACSLTDFKDPEVKEDVISSRAFPDGIPEGYYVRTDEFAIDEDDPRVIAFKEALNQLEEELKKEKQELIDQYADIFRLYYGNEQKEPQGSNRNQPKPGHNY